jgi:hypothetical protein
MSSIIYMLAGIHHEDKPGMVKNIGGGTNKPFLPRLE